MNKDGYDVVWPTELRGNSRGVGWLNKLLLAAKKSAIRQVKVVGGTGKIQDGAAIISMPSQTVTPVRNSFAVYNLANPTTPEDSFRTFNMRDGLIGARSRFFNFGFTLDDILLSGNYELPCMVLQDGQGSFNDFIAPTTAQVTFDNTADTQISGVDAGGNLINAGVFLPNATPSGAGDLNFSIWAEIIDSKTAPANPVTGGIYANLWGRMWTFSLTDPRSSNPFPTSSPTIFPIAVGINGTTGSYLIQQFQIGNLLNRFTAYNWASGLSGFGQPLNFRGDWTTESLSGQYFYPGDVITSGSFSVAVPSAHTFPLMFVRVTYGTTTTQPTVANSQPATPAGTWRYIS